MKKTKKRKKDLANRQSRDRRESAELDLTGDEIGYAKSKIVTFMKNYKKH